jgi:putative ABC transport system ATP-binding protein
MGNLPSQLSGGQQQRVAIARAIAHNPKIIFADEPTANLDTETSDMVLATFLELNKEGQTIVMVTHEKDYAALAHKVIELADGKVIHTEKNRGK